MMKKFILYLMAICLAIPLIGQTVTIQDVPDAEPGIVEVTISMTDFGNPVNAISLIFPYDANLISYEGYDLHFTGTMFTINDNYLGQDNKMSIQWISDDGKTIVDDFVTIQFKYNGGFGTTLAFTEHECEITYDTTVPFDVTYVAGSITPDLTDPDGTISIGTAGAVAGDPVDVPITITGFDQIDKEAHAITLRIGYDTGKLSFNNFSSNSLGFTGGPPVNGVLTLVVTDEDDPLSFSNPVIELNFTYLGGGPAAVEFLSGSLVANDEGETLITQFEAGSVSPQMETGNLIIEKVIADGATMEPLLPDPPGGEQLVPEAVTVDITAEGLGAITDMGMISLEIEFDADLLEYDGFIPASLPGTAWVITQPEPGRLSMQKTSDTDFTLDGVFMTLKFDYLYVQDPDTDGLAYINWLPGTFLQRNDTDLTFVDPELENGWVNTGYELDVKVFLEGPYREALGEMDDLFQTLGYIPEDQPYNTAPWNYSGDESATVPAGVVDWIFIQIREATLPGGAVPATVKWEGAVFLNMQGQIVSLDGTTLPVAAFVPDDVNDLFVVVYHRTHLAIMSATHMNFSGGTLAYDFSNSSVAAYDASTGLPTQKELAAGLYGMFVGDVDQSTEIDFNDMSIIFNLFGDSGYSVGDVNMDNQIDFDDVSDSFSNQGFNSYIPE